MNVTSALTHHGVPQSVASRVASNLASGSGSRSGAGQPHALVHDVQLAVAHSRQTVFYVMAGVMAATFLVALRDLPRGRVVLAEEAAAVPVTT